MQEHKLSELDIVDSQQAMDSPVVTSISKTQRLKHHQQLHIAPPNTEDITDDASRVFWRLFEKHQGETACVEFKVEFTMTETFQEKMIQEVLSIYNSDGSERSVDGRSSAGYILFGISDDHQPKGLSARIEAGMIWALRPRIFIPHIEIIQHWIARDHKSFWMWEIIKGSVGPAILWKEIGELSPSILYWRTANASLQQTPCYPKDQQQQRDLQMLQKRFKNPFDGADNNDVFI